MPNKLLFALTALLSMALFADTTGTAEDTTGHRDQVAKPPVTDLSNITVNDTIIMHIKQSEHDSLTDTLSLDQILELSAKSPSGSHASITHQQNELRAQQLQKTNRATLGLTGSIGYSEDVFTSDNYGYNSAGLELIVPITGGRQEDRWKSWAITQDNRVTQASQDREQIMVEDEVRKAFYTYWNGMRKIELIATYELDKALLLDVVNARIDTKRAVDDDIIQLRSLFSFIHRDAIRSQGQVAEALWTINYHTNSSLVEFSPTIDTLSTTAPTSSDTLVVEDSQNDSTSVQYGRSVVSHYLSSFVGVHGRLDWKWETGQGNDYQLFGGIRMPLNIGSLVRNRKDLIALQELQQSAEIAKLQADSDKEDHTRQEGATVYRDQYNTIAFSLTTLEDQVQTILFKMKFAPNIGVEDLFAVQFQYLHNLLALWDIEEIWINSTDTQGTFTPLPELCSITEILQLTTASTDTIDSVFNRRSTK